MEDDLKWIVGLAATFTLATASSVIGTLRHLSGKIAKTHERIDNVKDNYVRRDDLDGHLTRIDRVTHEIREEMRDNHRAVMAALSAKD